MQDPEKIGEYIDLEPNNTKKERFFGALKSFFMGPYFVIVCMLIVAFSSFFLGFYARGERGEGGVRIYNAKEVTNNPPPPGQTVRTGYIKGGTGGETNTSGEVMGAATDSAEQVVASKNGTKYHYPWCAGAKQIADKNKITFNSIAEARSAGYTPASNCKGLK